MLCFWKTNRVRFGTLCHESAMAEEYPKNHKSQKIGKLKGHDVLQRLGKRRVNGVGAATAKAEYSQVQMFLHEDVK